MKKIRNLFVCLGLLGCSLATVACSNNKTSEVEAEPYKVTFYDGETVLKTEMVKDGESATKWEPKKEGYTFVDWYGTPNFKFKYNFEAVHKDTSVYALFQSNDFVEDTRPWAIVGNGTGKVLSSSSFGKNITEEHLLKKSSKKDVNEYSITLDLAVGDEFQFAIDTDWSNQRGAGYLSNTALDGKEYFEVKANHLSTNTKKCNIGVLISGNYTLTLTTHPNDDYYDTQDAYYTEADKEKFNYSNSDAITWVRNGDITEVDDTVYDMYVKGNLITSWAHKTDPEYKMDYDATTRTYTYTHQFYDYDEFMFYSLKAGGLTADGGGFGPLTIKYGQVNVEKSTDKITGDKAKDSNFSTLANGTYTFTYSLDTRECIVTYDPTFTLEYTPNTDWYIVGGGSSELLSISNWGRKNLDDRFKLKPVEGENLKYSITLDLQVNDEFQIVKDGMWGLAHSFSFVQKPVVDDKVYFADSGNIQCKTAGNYTLTLNVSDTSKRFDTITWVRNGDVVSQSVKKIDLYYKLSSHEDWAPVLIDTLLSNAEAKVTLDLAKDDKLCFVYTDHDQKITPAYPGNLIRYTALGAASEENANANFSTNADYNFVCDVAGKYEFTIDYSTGAPIVNTKLIPAAKAFQAIIKGTMTGWKPSEKMSSEGDTLSFNYTFAEDDEFGFAWYDETTTTSYGNWIGIKCLGTTGTANSFFAGENNFKCSKAGTYNIKIVKDGADKVTVDFYNI